MRLLVDTNIFLDILMARKPFNDAAKSFFVRAWENKDEIYVCGTTLKDISYQGHRLYHSYEKTNKLLIDIFSRVSKIVGVSTDDSIEALYMDGDYEDNLLALTAETSMCDAIISRDKTFKNFRVVLSPEKYLDIRNKWD